MDNPQKPVWDHHGLGMKRLTSFLRRVLLHRRLLAGVAAMVCVLAVCSVASGPDGPTTEVWVARQRIPAGQTITEADLSLVTAPSRLVPSGAVTSASQAAGQMAAAAVAEGAIVTHDTLVASSRASPGTVIVELTASPQILAIVEAGDHVSVFLTDHATGQTQTVRGIRVVTIPRPDSSGPFSTTGSTGHLLVEAPEAIASQIAAGSSAGSVAVAVE